MSFKIEKGLKMKYIYIDQVQWGGVFILFLLSIFYYSGLQGHRGRVRLLRV